MRIDAYNQIQQIYGNSQLKKTQENKPTSARSFRDELKLSASGIEAQLAKQAVASSPDIRRDIVDPIKEQIDSDIYEVDTDDFASKLLEKYNGLF